MGDAFIVRRGGTVSGSTIPDFSYTGDYELVDYLDQPIKEPKKYKGDFKIRFLTSGQFIINKLNKWDGVIDVYLVGPGGSAGPAKTGYYGSTGGGGGRTKTVKGIVLAPGTVYNIVIPAGMIDSRPTGQTTAFGIAVDGGTHGEILQGGSGGNGGGLHGGYGGKKGVLPTKPTSGNQGTTLDDITREFDDPNGTLYAGGGGYGGTTGKGGLGGGGDYNQPGKPNTGGGAGGNSNANGWIPGGSGIVIIRNHKEVVG